MTDKLKTDNRNGLLMCLRYAFPPNNLHYCGPEKQENAKSYFKENIADKGLVKLLQQFETLYPYLTFIAKENNFKNPFHPKVVEAYWIGNQLLANCSTKGFYNHLIDSLQLPKKVKREDIELLMGKVSKGVLPHHTFHVFNIFMRTGHHSVPQTLDSMDSCRISWGKVISKGSNSLLVKTKPLIFQNDKLVLGFPITKSITVVSPSLYSLVPNSNISFHWNTFCDVLTLSQVKNLEFYTNHALLLANKTV